MKSIKEITNIIRDHWDSYSLINKDSVASELYKDYCLCVEEEINMNIIDNVFFGSLDLTLNDFERYIDSLKEATK